MTYQRAQRLKNVGLGRLMVDRIVSGQGVGRSIKSAISDKTTAKFTRMKEKFDPLNIGKMFGGRLGAYAVGKMTGRREEDIAYFTGARVRSSALESMKVNPLVTKIPEGDKRSMKKNDGLADVMARIYNLIKTNSEELKIQSEIDKNLNVDREKQREKWHSELIKALTGVGSKTTTATPVKKGGFLDDIMDFIEGSIAKVKDFFKPVLDFFGKIKEIFGEGVLAAFGLLKSLLANPFIQRLAGGVALGVLIAEAIKFGVGKAMGAAQDSSEELGGPEARAITESIQNSENRDQLSEMPGSSDPEYEQKQEKLKSAIRKKQSAIEKYLNSKGYTKKGEEKNGRFIFADSKGNQPPPELLNEASDLYNSGNMPTVTATKATPLPVGVTPSTAGAGRGTMSAEQYSIPTTAAPMPPAPASTGTRVQSAISQNISMNLDQDTAKIVTIDNSKTVNASGGSSAPAISMDSSVTVRTDDPTLKNIFKSLTRQT